MLRRTPSASARPARGPARTSAVALALIAAALSPAVPAAPASASDARLAPAGRCASDGERTAPRARQERALRCLINWARARHGLRPLRHRRVLTRSAAAKNRDLARCGVFEHAACGRHAFLHVRRAGYPKAGRSWGLGENLAWGSAASMSARSVMAAWLASPGHRATILTARFRHQGVRRTARSFAGRSDAVLWTLHAGYRR